MALDIQITISGPGGTLTYELEMVRKLFADLGHNVQVIDDCPEKTNKHFEFLEAAFETGTMERHNILLVADHQPWGG